jgi:acyl-coenzyme A thioesterase PaaI-like protein
MTYNDNLEEVLKAYEPRVAAASSLRKLGHAFVAHEIDENLLTNIHKTIDKLLPTILKGAPRVRAIAAMKRAAFSNAPKDGETIDHFPDCVVSGQENPLGIAATGYRDKDEAVIKVTLGAAFEGAPGRAHGGVVASLFDDTMGMILNILETPAYTGKLSISYLAPTPVKENLEFRAKCEKIEGRKIFVTAQAKHNDTLVATAEAIFITVPQIDFVSGSTPKD